MDKQCVTLTFAEQNRLALSLSGNKPLINAFFQVKLKLPLSKLIINFANYQLNLNETN